MTVLIDSDILIEVLRGRNLAIVARWSELGGSEAALLYSPVSAAELWAGARLGEYETLDALFRTLRCTTIDEPTGRQAGMYLQKYRRSHGLEIADALIAACATSNGAALWTRNRKHYPMRELSFFE